jgi:hypothetical protein
MSRAPVSAAARAEYARSQDRQDAGDVDAMVAYGQQYARDHPDEEEDSEIVQGRALEEDAIAATAPPPPPAVRCATPPRTLYRQCSHLRFDPADPSRIHLQWAVGWRYVLERRLAVLDAKATEEGVTPAQRAAAKAEVDAAVAAHAPSTLLYLANLHEDVDPTLNTIQSWASLDYILSECRAHDWDEMKIPLHISTRLSTDFDQPDDPLLNGRDLEHAKELMRQAQMQATNGSGTSSVGTASSTK